MMRNEWIVRANGLETKEGRKEGTPLKSHGHCHDQLISWLPLPLPWARIILRMCLIRRVSVRDLVPVSVTPLDAWYGSGTYTLVGDKNKVRGVPCAWWRRPVFTGYSNPPNVPKLSGCCSYIVLYL